MKTRGVVLAAMLGSSLACSSALAELMSFRPDAMSDIESRHAGEPFVAVLWSIDCAPCRDELALLSEFRLVHPELEIVLISTDGADYADAVREVLSVHGLAAAESWLFGDGNADRLRFAIDPEWFGEMPRAYLYAPDSSRRSISGALSAAVLREWLETADSPEPEGDERPATATGDGNRRRQPATATGDGNRRQQPATAISDSRQRQPPATSNR